MRQEHHHASGALDRLFGHNIGEHIKTLSGCRREVSEAFERLDLVSKWSIFSFFGKWTEQEMQDMKFPKEFQVAHDLFKELNTRFFHVGQFDASQMMQFLESAGLLRNGKNFANIAGALWFGAATCFDEEFARKNMNRIRQSGEAALSVDCGALSAGMKNGLEIAAKIRAARVAAIENFLKTAHFE